MSSSRVRPGTQRLIGIGCRSQLSTQALGGNRDWARNGCVGFLVVNEDTRDLEGKAPQVLLLGEMLASWSAREAASGRGEFSVGQAGRMVVWAMAAR